MEFKSPAEEQQYLFKVELPNLITRILLLSTCQRESKERILRDSEALKKASIQSIEACKNSLIKERGEMKCHTQRGSNEH